MVGVSTGTVVALASGPGRGGVAVIRLSGPAASMAIKKICRPSYLPDPRKAALREFVDFRSHETLDRGLVLWFPAPASFTGEDVAEFHIHGGHAIIKGMLSALCAVEGVSLAQPGDFSRRAFENGKLDLTEAEGIADLVEAETATQRRQALRQMDGALGRLYEDWAARLKHQLAMIEAEIDFADEEIPPDIGAGRKEALELVAAEIEAHLHDGHRGEKIREGFMITLLGAPNAGKSTLLNALARREAAIVSDTPGTTRDVIEVQLDLGGYAVTLADTAGLRQAADSIEAEGVRRALHRAEMADLKILLFDGTKAQTPDRETLALRGPDALVVVNKLDQIDNPQPLQNNPDLAGALFVSAETGVGISALSSRLVEEIDKRFVGSGGPALTRARHRHALEDALAHLNRAVQAQHVELCAEDIRLSVRAIGRITGRVDVEDLLDVIFSSFCIGK